MSVLESGMGPFYMGVQLIVGAASVSTALYLAFRRHLLGYKIASSLVVWFIVVHFVSVRNNLVGGLKWDIPADLPGVGLANMLFGVPIVAFVLAWRLSEAFRRFLLSEVPAAALIAFHWCRIAGAAYLYLFFNGTVRNVVALQVGVFDVVISLTALPLAFYVHRVGLRKARGLVMAWNVFGALDLAIPFTLFPLNLFGIFYTPEQSLSFFMIHPITTIFLYNVSLAGIVHVLFITKMDAMIEGAGKEKGK